MRISEKKNLALVLSGGGIKAAAYHIGVCLALRDKGFKFAGGSPTQVATDYSDDSLTFKTYVGSSAGAVISTFLAAGFDVDSIINAFTRGAGLGAIQRAGKHPKPSYLKAITYKDIFALNVSSSTPANWARNFFKKSPMISGGIEVLLKKGFKVNGLFSMRNVDRYFRDNVLLDNDFKSLGVKLYIIATQLNHSRKVIFGPFDKTTKDDQYMWAGFAQISSALAASASLPPIFTPYPIINEKGKEFYFFDGEIRETLSTHVAADTGCDLVIASYSLQPYHYNAEMGSLHEYGMPIISNQALYQTVQQKIDSHIRHQKELKGLIRSVDGYLKESEIPEHHREKLLEILYERTRFKPDTDYIYIHPSPEDYRFFFADHFSLNPTILGMIVRTGFRSAMTALRGKL